MDATYENYADDYTYEYDSPASGLRAWFMVSGDTDDFIFFDEPDRAHSDR